MSSKKKRPRRTPRTFTPEFKADVVRLCESGSESVAEVCRRLELTESAVRKWMSQANEPGAAATQRTRTARELEELSQLRRELKQVTMERDILKKAVAFFAKGNS